MSENDLPRSDPELTPRQAEVLALLRSGMTDDEIGRRIGMSPMGVQYHVQNVLAKLGVDSREDLVSPESRHRRNQSGSSRRLPRPLRGLAYGRLALVGVAFVMLVGGLTGGFFVLTGSDDAASSDPSLSKLAYMVDGDVWVVELPDGEPVRLTEEGTYASPVWSASGEWVSVRLANSFQGSYVLPADGGERRLASGCSWSPVEDVLACSSGTVLRIEAPEGEPIANYDLGSLLVGMPAHSTFNAFCPSWSNDGKYLACDVFALREGFVRISGAEGEQYDAIWVIAADGSSAREVVAGDPIEMDEYFGSFGWTEDDLALVFVRYSVESGTGIEEAWKDSVEVSIVPVTGGQPVTQDSVIVPRASLHGGRTPDGLAAFAAGEGRQMWTGKRIAVVDQATGSTTFLTEAGDASLQPAWSPNYSRIAYVAAPDAGRIEGLDGFIAGEVETSETSRDAWAALAERRIWVMDADGGNKRQLTSDPRYRDELPLWSEDGEHILFARIDEAGSPSIWLMNSDGSDAEMVVELSPCDGSSCYGAQFQADFSGPFWLGYHGLVPWSTQFAWWQPDEPESP